MICFLAGLYEPTHSTVLHGLSKRWKDHKFVGLPLSHNHSKGSKYAEACIVELKSRIGNIGEVFRNKVVIISISDELEPFSAKNFVPFGLVIEVKVNKSREYTDGAARILGNRIRMEIHSLLPRISRGMDVIYKEISKINRTPLILPCMNFGSKSLINFVFRFSIRSGDNIEELGGGNFTELYEKIRIKKSSRSKTRYFLGKNDISYHAAGHAMHGKKWNIGENKGHDLRCFMKAAYRMGCQIIEGFHYDCCIDGKEFCEGHFVNCHGYEGFYRSAKNLNIYPNDYIR